ncbi:MAG: hypothetical protein JRI23_13280 [Deltaproteobacteria bacterium]|jgi:hypothetical protein|nr:hypothetical protein [Deltaproteobacteria bacterium]MBW2532696.1 hypothetical protein [Deltaproteobacteria bacterium]
MGEAGEVSTSSVATRAGLALGKARLARRPLVLVGLLAVCVAFAFAVVEHESGPSGAVDRTFDGVFRWVVPLVSFVVVGIGLGPRGPAEAAWTAARFGLSRRLIVGGLLAAVMLVTSLVNVLAVDLAVLAAASAETQLAADLWAGCWIAALGSWVYVAWFAAGASVLRSGAGRWVVLLVDFVLGEGVGAAAVPWPRAHLHSLVGGAAVMDLAQPVSSGLLLCSAGLLVALVAWRTGA